MMMISRKVLAMQGEGDLRNRLTSQTMYEKPQQGDGAPSQGKGTEKKVLGTPISNRKKSSSANEVEMESVTKVSYVDMGRKGTSEEVKGKSNGNRDIRNGLSLHFEDNDEEKVCISMEDVIEEQRYWSCALIGYVLGSRISFAAMECFVRNQWKMV
ncbi:hypothetical protein Droror1_Dr00027192 [Drosera rotundifolia]